VLPAGCTPIVKSLLLLFFRKEDSSFLKERSKELLLLLHSLPAPPGLFLPRTHISPKHAVPMPQRPP
jgi:hypothetical protein